MVQPRTVINIVGAGSPANGATREYRIRPLFAGKPAPTGVFVVIVGAVSAWAWRAKEKGVREHVL